MGGSRKRKRRVCKDEKRRSGRMETRKIRQEKVTKVVKVREGEGRRAKKRKGSRNGRQVTALGRRRLQKHTWGK